MNTISKTIAGAAATVAMSVGGVALSAGSASAAPINQEGLVNVGVDTVNVQIPIAAAANICGVGVAVLAAASDLGDVECTADGVALANNDGSSGGPVNQRGLVNVALTDVSVQVPVTVAANVCGVAVGVLAQAESLGDVTCDTEGVSLADLV
jgi:hypothetical protein